MTDIVEYCNKLSEEEGAYFEPFEEDEGIVQDEQ